MAWHRGFACALLAWAWFAGPGRAADTPSTKAARPMTIGYVELTGDPRYMGERASPRPDVDRPAPAAAARPFPAAQMAIDEAALIGRVVGIPFSLRRGAGADTQALAKTVQGWAGEGVQFVVADLPAGPLVALADALKAQPVLILNATAPDDVLRGKACRVNLAHTIPSEAMRADALVQFLVWKRWRDILVLQGPSTQDQAGVAALSRAAKKFGARIVRAEPFQLTNDPRQREQSDVALITAGGGYDVVDVIDSQGDFARSVPYATKDPRPVVGTTGLVSRAWHWSWDDHGAIQLNARFQQVAGRPMQSGDWGAWAAVKAVEQAVLRTKTTEFAVMRDYLLGERMNLDGYKGNPMSFRPWDHQLRQPMLLATANAVIARAPLPGFLHQTNDLDTLGVDRPETQCAF